MKLESEKSGNKEYLIISPYEDTYEFDMITGNKLPVILSCDKKLENGQLYYRYDITGMQSLTELASIKPLGYMELCMLVYSLELFREIVSEYLLTKDGMVLMPEYVFYDRKERNIKYVFYPCKELDEFKSYSILSEFLLTCINYDDERAVKLAYEVYAQVLNKDYNLGLLISKSDVRNPYNIEQINSLPSENAIYEMSEKGNETITHKLASNNNRLESSDNTPELKKKRLSSLSIICLTLLFTCLICTCIITYFTGPWLIYYLKKTNSFIFIILGVSILIYFPIMDISDIIHSKPYKCGKKAHYNVK